jgi:8-oxo-dGTP pyrophosphatase MutT (NUDIX family)
MEEYFTIVWPNDKDSPQTGLVAAGCVTRNVAHSEARVPHATVQVLPILGATDRVLLHQRPPFVRNAPNQWDVLGGHVSFELGILSGANGLGEAYLETALREAREELLVAVKGAPHLIQKSHLIQIGHLGQFTWGLNDPNARNVEFSTVYVLRLPPGAHLRVPFEKRDGTVLWLPYQEVVWDDLLRLYQASCQDPPPDAFTQSPFSEGFADGVGRILQQALDDPSLAREIGKAIKRRLPPK